MAEYFEATVSLRKIPMDELEPWFLDWRCFDEQCEAESWCVDQMENEPGAEHAYVAYVRDGSGPDDEWRIVWDYHNDFAPTPET